MPMSEEDAAIVLVFAVMMWVVCFVLLLNYLEVGKITNGLITTTLCVSMFFGWIRYENNKQEKYDNDMALWNAKAMYTKEEDQPPPPVATKTKQEKKKD